jgi:hypothetical protein
MDGFLVGCMSLDEGLSVFEDWYRAICCWMILTWICAPPKGER